MTELPRVVEPDHPKRVARFGTFEVDLQSRELRRNGRDVRLQVQPFRILTLLLERAGDVVTREELRERLWPSEFVDFDHSLNAAIRKLREALGDSAENPRFVETLARRGYRFIAPVVWDGEQVERKKWMPAIAVAAIFVVVIIASVVYTLRHRPPAAAPAMDAVAILPFTNDDPQTQHQSDGLTEILIDRLSRLPDLRVMARTTVFAYKGKDPRAAGEAMHVPGVISGNLRRTGDRYEIHVELIDVKDGSQLWGYQFDATTATLPAVQSHIADALMTQLRQGVSREQRRIIASRYTRDPSAYDSYLWGLHAFNNRQERGNLQQAIVWFNEAIARDPNFAAAYAGLANTYGVMVGYGMIPVREGTEKIVSLVRKTLQLDPNNAEALVSIATSKYRNLWDFAGAEADYRRALTINPNYAAGHEWYAGYLRSMGRWAEARRELELAYALDPLSPPINWMMCFNLYYERHYAEAVAFSQRAGSMDPRFASPICIGLSLAAMGRIDEAIRTLTPTNTAPDNRPNAQDPKKFFITASGWLQQELGTQERPVMMAAMYAQAGEKDEAFAWLERAYQGRVSMLADVNVDPAFDSLKDDPRYDDLLRRIGLPKVSPPPS